MLRNKNILSNLPRRNFLYSCSSFSFIQTISNLIPEKNNHGEIHNIDSLNSRYSKILSFQIKNEFIDSSQFIESFMNKALKRFGPLDLVTFHSSSVRFDIRTLEYFRNYAEKNYSYVSISVDRPIWLSESETYVLDLIICPNGDLYFSRDNRPISLELDFGLISVHSYNSKLQKREFLGIFNSDILIINNYDLGGYINDFLKMQDKRNNYLIYMPSINSTSLQGITVYGGNNEIITQAASGINQGVIFHLESPRKSYHAGINV